MPKGKYYLKGRYTNMKKFLAIFMVVAVVMGMTFIVMSSAEEADYTYTVNVSEPVDGKSTVSIDVNAKVPLAGIQMTLTVADSVSIVAKDTDEGYYSPECTKLISMTPVKTANAFQVYGASITGNQINFTTTSAEDVSKLIGGSENIFPSVMNALISFDIEGVTEVNADTVKVTFIKCMNGLVPGTSDVVYNLPEQEVTTTTEPEQVETTTEPEQVETTTEPEQVETTTEPEQVETTTESEQVETTTSDDPNTSDGSSLSMIVFVVLAVVSLACAAVVIVRRKRA